MCSVILISSVSFYITFGSPCFNQLHLSNYCFHLESVWIYIYTAHNYLFYFPVNVLCQQVTTQLLTFWITTEAIWITFLTFINSWLTSEAVLKLSPLNSSDAMHLNLSFSTWDLLQKPLMRDKELLLNCLKHFKGLEKSQPMLTNVLMVTKLADFVKT